MLEKDLIEIIKGEVSSKTEDLDRHKADASLFEVKPQVVVFPKDTEDIKAVMRYVSEQKASNPKLSITARTAGTCMSGGSLNNSIILSFTKYMNKLGEITENAITVEPGVYYRDIEKKTIPQDLIIPSYTASKDFCAIGGMVANNSAGEKTLTYGSTEKYVRKLKVVLTDGNEYEFSKLNKEKLNEKLKLESFEGEVYRKINDLINKNEEIIKNSKPKTSKNSAGYLIWNVKEGETFDLTRLFVGSQGTLGIITEITMGLVPIHKHKRLLAITLKNLDLLPNVVEKILSFGPETFESYDDNTYELAEKYLPEISKRVITNKDVIITLIAEFTATTDEEATKKATDAQKNLSGIDLETFIANTPEEAEDYWKIRRASFALLRDHSGESHRVAPFIDDIIVNPSKLADFLPRLNIILNKYKFTYTLAGHIGNGNFHLIPLVNMEDKSVREQILPMAKEIFDLVFEFEGSMAGEHNDGIIRTPFLKDMYGQEMCDIFEEIKNIFDPQNILNPGKKVRGTLEYAMEHFSHSNISEHL